MRTTTDHFCSLGFQVQNGVVFNPLDIWGVGYAQTMLGSGDHEKLVEGYYNFRLSEKLRLSFHLQHVFERQAGRRIVRVPVRASGCRRGSRWSLGQENT